MISQKIKLVLPRSNMPVGSNCARSIAIGALSRARPCLEHEGYEEGEHDTVQRERLDEADAEEHQGPGLVEGLRLAMDARYGLSYQIPHPRAGPDDRGARGYADPDHGHVSTGLQQRQQWHYRCQNIHSYSFRLSAACLDLLVALSDHGTWPTRCKPA